MDNGFDLFLHNLSKNWKVEGSTHPPKLLKNFFWSFDISNDIPSETIAICQLNVSSTPYLFASC